MKSTFLKNIADCKAKKLYIMTFKNSIPTIKLQTLLAQNQI